MFSCFFAGLVPPRWPWLKASTTRAADPGSIPAFPWGLFSGSSRTSDLNIATTFQAPGDIGLAVRLVGPVSIYYDWVR